MKQILHELDDDKSLILLHNIYNAMVQCDNCRLLVIERIIKRGMSFVSSRGVSSADLIMMSMFEGGQERYKTDFERLLNQSNFQIKRFYSNAK